MPRAIWTGSISFGLVTVPVSIVTAEEPNELAFHLLDRRDMSQVHNRRVSSGSGEEVPWEETVRGYRLDDGGWVVVTDDDLRAANVEATQTIDVLAAVQASEIRPAYFDKPYYLVPDRPGRKAYALLRDTLSKTGRVAIAKVVIRTRQHLAALVPEGDVLVLEVLRYPYELRSTGDLDLPSDLKTEGASEAEVKLARQLVDAISKPFDPEAEEYRDTYRDDVLALIAKKAQGAPVEVKEAEKAPSAQVVDIAELLKRSLDEAKKARV